jgi:phosphoribosylformimino-5-aminoimidazole carboxamide ribotide isomerase
MIEIFPAIDVMNGKCVRLTQGDFNAKKSYDLDPLEMALRFEATGLRRLHLVDLDGAREGKVLNWRVLERIASRTQLKIDFGGGLQSDQDCTIALECGAKQLCIGSLAVRDQPKVLSWLERYGAEVLTLALDVKDEKVVVQGWKEKTDVFYLDLLAAYAERGLKYVASTVVNRDGMLAGPEFDYYQRVREEFPKISLVASGGVSGLEDIEKLEQQGLYGVIIGKALFEGKILLPELARFL